MNFNYPLILGSESPRRKELLSQLGYSFTTVSAKIDESVPNNLPAHQVAENLAMKKYESLRSRPELDNAVIITADTVVISNNKILNKPGGYEEAMEMIRQLVNSTHKVITGVCIGSKLEYLSFSDQTLVTFGELSQEEIHHYIEKYAPFDKAGAYGIQEWIGMVGIEKIEGSFYTVKGLPVHRIYQVLKKWK